jgi:hypothetical protein
MKETKDACRILAGKPLLKSHSEDGGDGSVTLIWILESWVVRMGDGWNWLRIVSNGRLWY